MSAKRKVELTPEQRNQCLSMIRSGAAHPRAVSHANVLIKTDCSPGGPAWRDKDIADALNVSIGTVSNIRQVMVEEGLDAALSHYDSSGRDYTPKLDGRQEAHLIALATSPPPEGHARWSLRLLAKHIVLLGHVEEVSHVTVGKVLKRGLCSLRATCNGASLPPKTQSS